MGRQWLLEWRHKAKWWKSLLSPGVPAAFSRRMLICLSFPLLESRLNKEHGRHPWQSPEPVHKVGYPTGALGYHHGGLVQSGVNTCTKGASCAFIRLRQQRQRERAEHLKSSESGARQELNEGTDVLQLTQNTTPWIQHWPSLWKEPTCIISGEKIWQYKLLKQFNPRGRKKQDFYVNHQPAQATISNRALSNSSLVTEDTPYLHKWGKAVYTCLPQDWGKLSSYSELKLPSKHLSEPAIQRKMGLIILYEKHSTVAKLVYIIAECVIFRDHTE